MHVQHLRFAVGWPQIRKKYYKNSPSRTKACKTKQADVQIPSSITNNPK